MDATLGVLVHQPEIFLAGHFAPLGYLDQFWVPLGLGDINMLDTTCRAFGLVVMFFTPNTTERGTADEPQD